MKSPVEYITGRRKSEDKVRWKDQISPKIRTLGRFRSRHKKPAEDGITEREEFTIVHFPDRPARRVTSDEIPTEEECRIFLMDLREKERLNQLQAKDEAAMESSDEEIDPALFGIRLQVPSPRRNEYGVVPSRTYSPQPFIGQAREVKLKKMNTTKLGQSTIACPTTAPCLDSDAQRNTVEKSWDMAKSTQPSINEYVLRAHVRHISQGSGNSESHCLQCHVGLRESSMLCQNCQLQNAASQIKTPNQARKPRYSHRPPKAISTSIPHQIDRAVIHRASNSEDSYSMSNSSMQSSPRMTSIATALSPAPPLTPLSEMPTPRILERLEGQKVGGAERDLYDEDWAGYYFDDENFPENEADIDKAGKFMSRELSLEEYDSAFASPARTKTHDELIE